MALITKELLKRYKTITAEDVVEDPEFANTPIIVTKNSEREMINASQSRMFALRNKTPRFSWKRTMKGKLANDKPISHQGSRDHIYQNYSEFTSHFVAGAPGFLIENINVSRKLANGTPVTYHSLQLDPREDREHILDALTHPRGIEDIHLKYPPLYINVIVDDADPAEFDGFSLVPGQIVIPAGVSSKQTKHKVYIPKRLSQVETGTKQHNSDFRFSFTMHKIQGQTCLKLIIDLNARPFPPPLSLEGLYVMCSRVPRGDRLRLMPPQPNQAGFPHLLKLKRNPDLLAWLNAFDSKTGVWNASRCPRRTEKKAPKRKSPTDSAAESSTLAKRTKIQKKSTKKKFLILQFLIFQVKIKNQKNNWLVNLI